MQNKYENIWTKLAETVGVCVAQIIAELMQSKNNKKE